MLILLVTVSQQFHKVIKTGVEQCLLNFLGTIFFDRQTYQREKYSLGFFPFKGFAQIGILRNFLEFIFVK